MSVIKREIEIQASVETVWEHLESADLLAGWLMRNDFRPELGADFRFFSTPRGGFDGVVHCRVVELDPPRRLAFTWNASDIGADTLVSIDLVERGTATLVQLHHARFADATGDVDRIVALHDEGWSDHLAVLGLQAGEASSAAHESPAAEDWTEFCLHVAIAAPPEKVLEHWATSRGMEAFFVEMMRITAPDGSERPVDRAAEPGDGFIWRWHNGRRVRGSYLPPEHGDEVRFSFVESKVSVRAVPYIGGTMLCLRQFDIPDTESARMHIHANCRGAWVYFLSVLKTLLEHGVDGRDRTRATGSSFATSFDPKSLGLDLP